MMNRLLIRCSASFMTSFVRPCNIRPQPQHVSTGLEYLHHFGHCTRSSIFDISCRSRLPFVHHESPNLDVTHGCVLFSVFYCAYLLIKSAIIVDSFGEFKTLFCQGSNKKCLLFLVWCMWYFWLTGQFVRLSRLRLD